MVRGAVYKIHFGVLEDQYDYFWQYQNLFLFINFFRPKLKNFFSAWYGPKSIKFEEWASIEGPFDILE